MAEIYRAKTFDAQGTPHLVAVKRVLAHLAEDDDFILAIDRQLTGGFFDGLDRQFRFRSWSVGVCPGRVTAISPKQPSM